MAYSRNDESSGEISVILITAVWSVKRIEYQYHQISNVSLTKCQNLNVSGLVLQLSLCNLLEPGVKSKMKMQLEQRRQAMLQLHLSDQQFHCLLRCCLY